MSTFMLDGREIAFREGETVMQAALDAGAYVPHLCFRPGYEPHGSCKVCTVSIDGRNAASCTTRARAGMKVESATPELADMRRALVEMLFAEGNHTCPACEKSGDCELQAVGYHIGMDHSRFDLFFPGRDLDASHPDVMLDRNRCILCDLCVRASRDVDGKRAFAIAGRGIRSRLVVDSPSGLLRDSKVEVTDAAVRACPVGALLPKRRAYQVPIGERTFDRQPIREVAITEARQVKELNLGAEPRRG
jgi:[NiFe] hydrogenase diaphorase moiety small subunit